jgi:hypothetical protein
LSGVENLLFANEIALRKGGGCNDRGSILFSIGNLIVQSTYTSTYLRQSNNNTTLSKGFWKQKINLIAQRTLHSL